MTNDRYTLPSDISQSITVARYEMLKHLRSKRLLGLFALELVIIILILIVPPAVGRDYPSDPADFEKMFIQWVWILIVVGSTLFAGDALVSEFQNRTGYLLFPNPVKRWVLCAGKFAATVATIFLALGIFYGVVSGLALAVDGGVSSLTADSFGIALLAAVSAAAVGYLISALMKGSTGALVLTFALLFLILPIADGILSFAAVKPEISLTFSAGAIDDVLNTPYPVDSVVRYDLPGGQVFEMYLYYPNVATAFLVMLLYAVGAIAIALWRFSKREMAA